VKLRLVVAEHDRSFLRTLLSLLGSEFEIVATAADGDSAIELASELRPDVVVLDLELSGRSGIEVTKKIVEPVQPPAVVVCSLEADPDIVHAARQAGALGYVLKSRLAMDLITAVRAAAKGDPFLSPG
jgi:DNA-binding NarL/FixJ family response regulator